MDSIKKIAICCTSGGYKNVFAQGVLTAFEEKCLTANIYTACSSSTLITAFAAFHKIKQLGLDLWKDGYKISQEDNGDQSRAMLYTIRKLSPEIITHLWEPTSNRLLIATSCVKTEDAISIVQSEDARRLGKTLLINALRHTSEWKDKNLESILFDTKTDWRTKLLTKDNFNDVAYATTRMLHAWKIPAYIDNRTYIDGSYTSYCPIRFLSQLKLDRIICICTERENICYDIFGQEEIPDQIDGISIDFIKPDFNLKEMGLDFYTIREDGIEKGYEHGYAKGLAYANALKPSINS